MLVLLQRKTVTTFFELFLVLWVTKFGNFGVFTVVRKVSRDPYELL